MVCILTRMGITHDDDAKEAKEYKRGEQKDENDMRELTSINFALPSIISGT